VKPKQVPLLRTSSTSILIFSFSSFCSAWSGYRRSCQHDTIIPIIHVNESKTSKRNIYGTIDDLETVTVFTGYDYRSASSKASTSSTTTLPPVSNGPSTRAAPSRGRSPRQAHCQTSLAVDYLGRDTSKCLHGPKKLKGEYIEGSYVSYGILLLKANKDRRHSTMAWVVQTLGSLRRKGPTSSWAPSHSPQGQSQTPGLAHRNHNAY
jgi:hypothetical protein